MIDLVYICLNLMRKIVVCMWQHHCFFKKKEKNSKFGKKVAQSIDAEYSVNFSLNNIPSVCVCHCLAKKKTLSTRWESHRKNKKRVNDRLKNTYKLAINICCGHTNSHTHTTTAHGKRKLKKNDQSKRVTLFFPG